MAYENWTVEILFADWVDVTADVDTISSPINATSGETTEADDAAGSATIELRNPEQRYTPGNVLSDLYPYVRSGRQLRIRETVGDRTYDIFTGRLKWPDVESWVKSSTTEPREQSITLTAVDLVEQLDNAATFVSTLSAHITWAGGDTLAGYWPMTDRSTPFLPVTGQNLPMTPELYNLHWGDPTATTGSAQVTPSSAEPMPGEDVSFAQYEMEVQTVSGFLRPAQSILTQTTIPSGTFTVQPDEVMTLVMWIKSPWTATDSEADPAAFRFLLGPSSEGFMSLVKQDGAGSTWLMDVSGSSGLFASFTGPVAATDRWTLVGMRWGFDPAVAELWVDDSQTVGLVTGSTPATEMQITQLYAPLFRFDGSVAHVQLYIGAPEAWSFEHFTAQRRVGLDGLERQTTGARIRSVLRYAGVAETDMTRIDPGVAVMQRALMAGRTPGALVAEAVATERGSFYADGSGLPVFNDRRTLYNV